MKEMATHSSILAWEISWTEEPDGLQFMGSQKELDMTKQQTIFFFLPHLLLGTSEYFVQDVKKCCI